MPKTTNHTAAAAKTGAAVKPTDCGIMEIAPRNSTAKSIKINQEIAENR